MSWVVVMRKNLNMQMRSGPDSTARIMDGGQPDMKNRAIQSRLVPPPPIPPVQPANQPASQQAIYLALQPY